MIPLSWYVMLSAGLFTIGVVGVLSGAISSSSDVHRLMLNAANINLVAFARYPSPSGHIFVIFVITVARRQRRLWRWQSSSHSPKIAEACMWMSST